MAHVVVRGLAAGLLCGLIGVLRPGPAQAAAPDGSGAARVVTLAPHLTEIIYAAGAGDKLVATVTSSDYPAAARALPRIGSGIHVNVERIIALRPDLIAAWMPSGAAQTLAPSAGTLQIPLIYSRPVRLDDIPAEILRFGRLLGTEPAAAAAAGELRRRLRALREQYAQRPPVSVFIEVGTNPLYTIGHDPLLADALRVCGAVNVYDASALPAPQVSAESVLIARPDMVIVSPRGPAGLEQRVGHWTDLKLDAALRRQVYAIDPDEMFRPGPRLIDATEKLCRDADLVRRNHGDGKQ